MWTLKDLRRCLGGACCACLLVLVSWSSFCLASGFDSPLTTSGGLSSAQMVPNARFVICCPLDRSGTSQLRGYLASDQRSSSCRLMRPLIWNRSSDLVPESCEAAPSSSSVDEAHEPLSGRSSSESLRQRLRSLFKRGDLHSRPFTDSRRSIRWRLFRRTASESAEGCSSEPTSLPPE